MNKWYLHKLESALENETHKILWKFDIHTDHLNSARRPDLVIVRKKEKKKKRKEENSLFCCPGRPLSKIKENENRPLLWNIIVTVIPIVIGALETILKVLVKGQEDLEIRAQMKT